MRSAEQTHDREDGTAVIWFLLCIAFVGLLMFFLVAGSGQALASLSDTADVAQTAARAGTTQVDPSDGRLLPEAAAAAARAELDAAGMTGSVSVGLNTVTVTASTTTDLPLLAVLGKPTHTATATRTATVLTEP